MKPGRTCLDRNADDRVDPRPEGTVLEKLARTLIVLRGQMDASGCKHVVPGLIFAACGSADAGKDTGTFGEQKGWALRSY